MNRGCKLRVYVNGVYKRKVSLVKGLEAASEHRYESHNGNKMRNFGNLDQTGHKSLQPDADSGA